jgi:glucose-6-phosphate 1-dehydrogenase
MAEPTGCDVFRIRITGDLAKVMTFRSLYRLEQRKLLIARSPACRRRLEPDQLVERARPRSSGPANSSTKTSSPVWRAG